MSVLSLFSKNLKAFSFFGHWPLGVRDAGTDLARPGQVRSDL